MGDAYRNFAPTRATGSDSLTAGGASGGCAGLPAVASAEWVKQSYAGAVEYGLLRFEGDTMQRTSPSEAQST